MALGANIVPFYANKIIEYQPKSGSDPYVYSPHYPLEILNYQSIINLSSKATGELKVILEDINNHDIAC